MADGAFEIGDVVHLKSGGNPMTVEMVPAGDADVRCVWFTEGEVLRGRFPAATLEECTADDGDDV